MEKVGDRLSQDESSLSVVLRCALTDYVARRTATLDLHRSLRALLKASVAIGTNLNQATRQLNSGQYPTELAEVVYQLAEHYKALVTALSAANIRVKRV